MKVIVIIISIDLVTNLLLSSFVLSYKPKTRIGLSASWWSGNKKSICFCLYRAALYLKAMLDSKDFYKRILLHAVQEDWV